MDLGSLGSFTLDFSLFHDLVSIVLINLVLSGDNAVVIAMAVRSLPADQRKKGIAFGAGFAVLLRIILTFFVAQLLRIGVVKLVGGLLIIWIAIKLFSQAEMEQGKEAGSAFQAIKLILLADITMSLDNMLALGAAAHGNLLLLGIGLALSIPFVVFASNLLSAIMDRYPVILWVGAAILGRVGGEMIITDPFITSLLSPDKVMEYGSQIVFTVVVLASGYFLVWRRAKEEVSVGRIANP